MSYPTFKLAAIVASLALTGPSLDGPATAASFYKATLLGADENPPVASPGGGVAFLTIDGDLLAASTISNLIGDVAAAHGRCCAAAPANAGVATQTPSFPGFPTGGASGSYNQGFDLNAPAAYNAAFVAANGGQAYFNVHTTFARGGEIRGQVALIPEPASWALMIAGFGIAGAAIRWRRSVFKT